MTWTASSWTVSALAASTVTPTAWSVDSVDTPAPEPDAFVDYLDDFSGEETDPTARGEVPWAVYKATAVGTGSVGSGVLTLEPVQGGAGENGSLWYTQNNTTQFDGMLLFKPVGPASGTPVGFDVRARISVASTSGAVGGEYRYCVLAVHDPSRASYYNYVHIGLGWDPSTFNVETKTTDVDAVSGESAFPVTTVDAGAYDVRIVRRTTDPQLFDTYYRPVSSGEALTSNVGWTLHHTIDRSDEAGAEDTIPSRANAVELPYDVQVGLAVYANPVAHDIVGTVQDFWIGETAD